MRELKALLIVSAISLFTVGCGGGGGSGGGGGPTFFTDNMNGLWEGTTNVPPVTPGALATAWTLTQATPGNSIRNAQLIVGTLAFPTLGENEFAVTGDINGNTVTLLTESINNVIFTYRFTLTGQNTMQGTVNAVDASIPPNSFDGTAEATRSVP